MSKRLFVDDAQAGSGSNMTSGHEAPPRPKVMRRPPQFSQNHSSSDAPTARQSVMAHAPQSAPAATLTAETGRAWQDDTRFGLVLILALVIVNLLLTQLMPFLPTVAMNDDNTTSNALFGANSMPQQVKQSGSDITIYADPSAHSTQFDLNSRDPEQNQLSVSPKDTPAPRARALDNQEQ